jgi:hypothetical protein
MAERHLKSHEAQSLKIRRSRVVCVPAWQSEYTIIEERCMAKKTRQFFTCMSVYRKNGAIVSITLFKPFSASILESWKN